jgi:hypothetical protein
MRKIIAGVNLTLDGYCDHSAMIAGDEIHRHYNDLFKRAVTLVYCRKSHTRLWKVISQQLVKSPRGAGSVLLYYVPVGKGQGRG